MASRTITIPHLGRVEGHGGIFVRLSENSVTEVDMAIHEGSRYYEALLTGKKYDEVQGLISRVCAICSASHSVAALMAIEEALGIDVSARVHDLRGLLLLGSTIESHALHVFALALPDFLGYDSVITMAADHGETVAFALGLKQLGNRIQELVGGRAIHPINTLVGGFGKIPSHAELRALRQELENSMEPLLGTVDLVAGLEVPGWAEAPTVFVALEPYEDGFRYRGKGIVTSRGENYDIADYRKIINEKAVAHSHAKHATLPTGDTYVVGALARLALWGDRLGPHASRAFEKLFPRGIRENMLLNNHAQLVELVHCIEHSIELIDRITAYETVTSEIVDYEIRTGRGIGALEAPRGALFHEYELEADGKVIDANVITPTAQNLANVERDMRISLESLLTNTEIGDDELKLSLEMIARAYDPCISCSVHIIRDEECSPL